jgi:vacuolar-type H+-ATPase subunit E/Vma4
MQGTPLAETITRQADQTCQANLERAKAEKAALLEQAKKAAEKRRDDVLKSLRANLAAQSAQAHAMAEIAAERETISMRQGLAEEVLSQAKSRIDQLAQSDAFGPILEGLSAQVLDACKSELGELSGVTVLVPPRHVDRIRTFLSSSSYGNVPVRGDEALLDGAAVQDDAQTFRISHTLTGRYERLENAARAISLKKLFGGEK